MKKIKIEFTREEALALGLLVCECGWPPNNHYSYGKKLCAFSSKCKGYKEKAKLGKIV